MFDLKFRGKLTGGLLMACSALLLVALLTYRTLARTAVDRDWVTHTLVVLERLSDLESQFAAAESAQRGYVLTGDAGYLEQYHAAQASIPEAVAGLRHLTADNPVQQGNLDQLEPLVTQRLALLASGIGQRNSGGFAAAQQVVATGSGKRLMEAMRSNIAGMQAEERSLLLLRNAELDLSTSRARLFVVFGDAIGFCFLVLAGAIIQREMNSRRRGEEEIRRLNADLERRVAERTAELSARSKELERSNLELQQFAYVASHDLQEPLRTISSFTQLLAKRYREQLDDKAREFIDFAVDGCKRMQALINDLLAFSRVGTQGVSFQPVPCDVTLARVLKSLRTAIEETRADIQHDALPLLLADEVQLGQLLQNLIGNALKYRGPEPPRIRISAERQGAFWSLQVRDNGIGIPPEHRDRIFIIFQRLHTKSQYSGTGIGLAVCKKIVERHGGSIWVESAPERGSIFHFTMPAGEISHAISSTEEKTRGPLRSSAAGH